MEGGVVPMFRPRKKLGPSAWFRASKATQVIFNTMIDYLHLYIRLRVIRNTHFKRSTLTFKEGPPKVAHKDFIPVRNYRLWEPMQADFLTNKKCCD